MERLTVVHIEDSDIERREMVAAFEKVDNLIMVGSTGDADESLAMVKEHMPNVIILDLELHDSSKDGFYFLKELRKLYIPYKPFVLVTTYNISPLVFASARELGADFVYSKTQRDYGTDLVIQLLTNIQKSILKNKYIYRKSIYHEDNRRKFIEQIDIEFAKIGMKRSKGYTYLKESIQLLYENNENYKEAVAKNHRITVKKVEDDMQYAIKRTWNNSSVQDLLEHYEGLVLSHTDIPTVKEFIHCYCEKIKKML